MIIKNFYNAKNVYEHNNSNNKVVILTSYDYKIVVVVSGINRSDALAKLGNLLFGTNESVEEGHEYEKLRSWT